MQKKPTELLNPSLFSQAILSADYITIDGDYKEISIVIPTGSVVGIQVRGDDSTDKICKNVTIDKLNLIATEDTTHAGNDAYTAFGVRYGENCTVSNSIIDLRNMKVTGNGQVGNIMFYASPNGIVQNNTLWATGNAHNSIGIDTFFTEGVNPAPLLLRDNIIHLGSSGDTTLLGSMGIRLYGNYYTGVVGNTLVR